MPLRPLDEVGPAVRPGADRALQARPRKCSADAVLDREPGSHAIGDGAVVLLPARGLGVVVDAVGVGQQAQPANQPRRAVERAQRLLEPAQRARRGPAHDDAPPPCAAQDRVESMCAPGAEHAHHVATADVDQILGEQVGGEIVLDAAGALVAPEQRDVAGIAGRGRSGGRSGRRSGRRHRRRSAGSRHGGGGRRAARGCSRRAASLSCSIEKPPPPRATIWGTLSGISRSFLGTARRKPRQDRRRRSGPMDCRRRSAAAERPGSVAAAGAHRRTARGPGAGDLDAGRAQALRRDRRGQRARARGARRACASACSDRTARESRQR